MEDALHAMDYMVYGHLQLAQNDAAKALLDEINGLEHIAVGFGSAYALAAIPARYVLERGAWDEAATIALPAAPFPWERFPQAEALVVFGRGLAAARAGDAAAARQELTALQALHTTLIEANNSYWAGQAEIQAKMVEAWIALVEEQPEAALALAQEAAALEELTEKHPVSPGQVKPAYELLGELLLELDRPAEALDAFETLLVDDPQRFRGLYGAARAAELAGDTAKAESYYTELLTLATNADGERSEVVEAQAFLAGK
jgi:predicted Zn-dependent protease